MGDVFRSRLGRTIIETDNTWFTNLTLNTNQVHFNAPYAEATRFGQILVNSCFTSPSSRPTKPDTSENAVANLGWTDIRLPKPVFVGDTLWAESEILELRPSESWPTVGDRADALPRDQSARGGRTEYLVTFMVLRRGAPEARSSFPTTDTPRGVG